MQHFMLDLETRGSSPGCAILSIGLVAFNPLAPTVDDLFTDFGYYTVVSAESCLDAGLHEDADTMKWWKMQSAEARKVIFESEEPNAPPLDVALQETVNYAAQYGDPRKAYIYGNGADFDNPILAVAARMVGVKLPWQWGNRCYRTLKSLDPILGPEFAAPKLQRAGTYHNALDDAKTQAMHLWEIVSTIRGNLGLAPPEA